MLHGAPLPRGPYELHLSAAHSNHTSHQPDALRSATAHLARVREYALFQRGKYATWSKRTKDFGQLNSIQLINKIHLGRKGGILPGLSRCQPMRMSLIVQSPHYSGPQLDHSQALMNQTLEPWTKSWGKRQGTRAHQSQAKWWNESGRCLSSLLSKQV